MNCKEIIKQEGYRREDLTAEHQKILSAVEEFVDTTNKDLKWIIEGYKKDLDEYHLGDFVGGICQRFLKDVDKLVHENVVMLQIYLAELETNYSQQTEIKR